MTRSGVLRTGAISLAAVAVAVLPFVITDRFLLKVFTYAGLNVLVVVGLSLLFGYAGQVSLGHAAFVGLGAYTCANLSGRLHLPWLVAFAAAGAVAGLGGLVLALPSLRLKGHYLAMATLAFGELASLAFVEATPLTHGVDGFTGIPFPTLGSHALKTPAELYWLVWGVVGVALLVAGNIVSLRPGRAMRALHGSELGAAACGVDITGVKVRAFVVSATLAGPLLAASALTLVQYLDALVPGMSRDAAQMVQAFEPDLYGLAIVLVVLFAPGGIGALFLRRAKGGERA